MLACEHLKPIVHLFDRAHLPGVALGVALPRKLLVEYTLALGLPLYEDFGKNRRLLGTDDIEIAQSLQTRSVEPVQIRFAGVDVATLCRILNHASHEELDDVFDAICVLQFVDVLLAEWTNLEVLVRDRLL